MPHGSHKILLACINERPGLELQLKYKKTLHYHHFPSQRGAHVGVMMILHGKDCSYLHIPKNVSIFYCTINIVVKSVLENSSVHLPLGISELGKMQIFGSRTAQKRN